MVGNILLFYLTESVDPVEKKDPNFTEAMSFMKEVGDLALLAD